MAVERWDVVVVGAGNAGLCAALAARESGARVLVLEKAPREERGGNTAFTGGLLRFPFNSIEDFKPLLPDYTPEQFDEVYVGSYTQDAYRADFERVTEGLAHPDMVDNLVTRAYPTMVWMVQKGIRWIMATGRQSYKVEGKYRFFGNLILEAWGGGEGLSDMGFSATERAGIEIAYGTKAVAIETDNKGTVTGLVIADREGRRSIACKAVVLCAGGFQSNMEWRTRYLGPDWELAKVRGTRFNTGDGIRMAMDIGAQPFGHWSSCHAVAWDMLAPPFGDRRVGDLFQKHSYPIGLIVNQQGKRFVDEGADFRNDTYAKYGREILRQPNRCAFQLFDSKSIPMLRDEYRHRDATKARANTIEELADQLTIDPKQLKYTIDEYNEHVQEGPYNPTILDGKRTVGLDPDKTNWAIKLDEPPYEGYAVTCGITFTFGGLRIDRAGRVLNNEDEVIPGLYAAGELVGGLFYYNYPGGSGLMAGATFGKLAGESAASYV